jgi:outer membrane protein assembly factor BamB
MTRCRWLKWCLVAGSFLATSPFAAATDWLHWRGPAQNGVSLEKDLPDEWDPSTPGQSNLVWKQPYGCRGTPLVMSGKVYIVSADGDTPYVPGPKDKLITGEQVVCFDAATGKELWKKKYNVFHTDIVTNRLGWSPLAADPDAKLIYCHLTGGELIALNAETGEEVWKHSLTEEYGRVTGYGGRVGGGPIFDSGLVIVGIVNAAWGELAMGANRWIAFDSKTGELVWWANAPAPIKGTYYSSPIVATIKGQRLLISGGADGGVHAFQVRTGKRAWSYQIAAGVVNPSPVVEGNLVYIAHGEENPEGGTAGLGRVVCLDASKVTAGKPALVWEFRRGVRFGLSSLAIADGRLYVPDDSAKLYCFNAKTGKMLWKYNYGTVARGAPLIADGKAYISETNYKFQIIKLKENEEPDEADTFTTTFRNKPGAAGFVEVNCTPSVADGRIYLATRDELYCIAKEGAKATLLKETKEPAEAAPGAAAQVQIIPADVVVTPGQKLKFTVKLFDANGQPVAEVPPGATWSLPQPPAPKAGAAQPPALDGTISAEGELTVGKKPAQHGLVEVKVGTLTGRARVRVAGVPPYKQDFEMVPVGAVPGGWVNAQGKFSVIEKDGSKVLFKKNDDPRPPLARAIGYITGPLATGYTIEADVMGVEKREKFPDAGIVANRYNFYLDSKQNEKGQREVRLISWEALPRINVEAAFDWKSGVWYRLKMTVENGEKESIVRCKVWEKGKEEPAEWTISFTDPRPNKFGAAGLYGYIQNAENGNPGSEAYYDNVTITPSKK